jgi:hypothetical protein
VCGEWFVPRFDLDAIMEPNVHNNRSVRTMTADELVLLHGESTCGCGDLNQVEPEKQAPAIQFYDMKKSIALFSLFCLAAVMLAQPKDTNVFPYVYTIDDLDNGLRV